MRVGILGGGQLAQLLTQAAISFGLGTAIYERQPDSPAARLTQHNIVGEWDDQDKLHQFAKMCDVITLENEFVYAESLRVLAEAGATVYPSAETLATVQDKLLQKQCYQQNGLPVPQFCAVETSEAIAAMGEYPLVLKTRYGGYDGYGNATIQHVDEIAGAWGKLGAGERALMVEAFVPFVRELAVMVVRTRHGEIRSYPVVETVQQNHICHLVRAPAPVSAEVAQAATALAEDAVRVLEGVGIFGVELFQLADGSLLLNEVAPRPHNSGHYTMDACVTSQFENHLRAVLDLPLGSTALRAHAAVMVNLLGQRHGQTDERGIRGALEVEGAHLHLYGKREVRPGRKMGHINVLGESLEAAEQVALQAAERVAL